MNNMNEEEILEEISQLKKDIDKLRKIKSNVINSQTDNIKIKIETKHWYGFGSNLHFGATKNNIYTSKELTEEILDEMIESKLKQATELINKKIYQRRKND